MNVTLIVILLAASAVMMFLEIRGASVTLSLNFKGDIKRETRWLAQYGQAISSLVAALLALQLDSRKWNAALPLAIAPLATGMAGAVIKRILGRVRPGHPGAGKFMGPSFRHANWRESFPSNHSASAVAFSVVAALLYPPAAATFWTLAIGCAVIRYLMDAHWPADVLAGIAFGYAMGYWIFSIFVH